MSWSPQQEHALKAVAEWIRNPGDQQVFRLFGYAGTGKTTLAKEMAATVKGKVLFATFTGKASLVLRKKGCEDASTIHSLIYQVEEDGGDDMTSATCKTCPTALSAKNRSGYCRACIGRVCARDPAIRAKISASVKRRLMSDPELMGKYRANAVAASRTPQAREARHTRWMRDKPWIKGTEARRDPEVCKRANRRQSATRLAWCPPHLRDEYRRLTRQQRMKADEARAIVLKQAQIEDQRFRDRLAREGYYG